MLALLLCSLSHAQSLALVTENDVYLSTWDRYYSAGNLLVLTLEPEHLRPLERLGLHEARVSVGFSNELYTPQYIFLDDYPPEARDWASWSGWSLAAWGENARGVGTLSLAWGWTGPISGGGWGQQTIHKLPGLKTPVGWDEQMPFEPTLNLGFGQLWPQRWSVGGLALSPYAVGMVGTWETGGTVGLMGSWGSAPRAGRPLIAQQTRAARSTPQPQGWSMHAGAELHGWVRYLPLDGVLLQDGPSANKRPGFGEAYMGIERRSERWTVGYEMVGRTREAHDQETLHRFGRIWVERSF